MKLLSSTWLWRGILGLIVSIFVSANYLVEPDNLGALVRIEDIDFDSGVRASIFALAAATLLFIPLIPKGAEEPDAALLVDWCIRSLGALTAFLAGWYWLLSETEGRPQPYLMAVLITAGVLVVVVIWQLAVVALIRYLSEKIRNRGR